MSKVGNVIRTIRTKKNMSLKELAEQTGMTSSHISQVERNLASPSLAALELIASAFQVPITALLSEPCNTTPLVKKNERESHGQLGNLTQSLVRTGQNAPFGVYIATVDKNQLHTGDMFHHIGTEFITIMQGALEYHLGEETYVLETGDSLCYDASVPHWGRKLTETMQALIVTSPFVIQGA